MQAPPLFNGFDPIDKPIEEFLQAYKRYIAINHIAQNRWADILDTLIEQPAKTAYDAALGGNGIAADADLAGMDEAATAVEFQNRFHHRRNWLRETYNGQEQQDIAKDVLEQMCQGIHETPQIFYQRIIGQVRCSGYNAAIMHIIAKQIFMKGIHPDI